MKTFKYHEDLNGSMATITINIQDTVAQRFRKTVRQERGEGKGILGKAVEEALDHWLKNKEQEEIAQRQIQLLKSGGFHTGKIKKYSRDELYDRK